MDKTGGNQIELQAYAKINLGLDVVRRLENGYHEVRMIMQTLDLCDSLVLRRKDPGIYLKVEESDIPADRSNLAYKAAERMMQAYAIKDGVEIVLVKRIPTAAGMAGGSTDAAAVMRGMNQLFHLGADREELMKLGVEIGADVPYCIMGGTALSEGIGEILTPLPSPPDCYVLVAKPEISVSTAFVYGNLNLKELKKHPDIDGMAEAIRKGSLKGVADRMENVLETVTVREYPVLEKIKNIMKENGALNALMSGSGPTVFGLYDNRKTVEEAYETLKDTGTVKQIFICRWKGGAYE